MKVEQIKSIVQSVYTQVTGVTDSETLDTMSIVDMGKSILDSTDVDNYVKTLTDVIGKTIFNDRKYTGNAPSVLMDSWEFGSVLRKIDVELDNSSLSENASYKLSQGQTYSQDTAYLPTATAKLFNKKVTFEIDVTITEKQAKSCFHSMNELNAFISMIYNAVDKAMTVYIDNLIMATINNMTAQTLNNSYSDGTYTGKTSIKAVNLLHEFNTKFRSEETKLTVAQALTDVDFLKFATMCINTYVDRLTKISTLFNIGAKSRFTPKEDLNLIMLSDFKSSCASYLQADTYHKELVSLPNSDTVAYWQGSGKAYDFDSVSKINVNIDVSGTKKNVECSGVLAVMFDKMALGVCNEDRRVTTHYNAKAEFFNNFYKFDCSYFNDLNENFVVFFIQ